MKRIVVVDGDAIWWTMWHSSAEDELSAARQRTLAKVREMVEGYEHVVIALDSPKSRRRQEYAEYKANRPQKTAQSIEEMRKTREALARDYRCLQVDGFEGDDIIGSIALWADSSGHALDIVGVDKDLWQCLGPNIELRKFTTGQHYTAEDLMAEHGIAPTQVPEWLALIGDTSDNVPGVPKCGPKTATKLLQRFGGLPGIAAAAVDPDSQLPPALRKALHDATHGENGGQLSTSLRLVTLRECLTNEQLASVLEPYERKADPSKEPVPSEPPEESFDDERISDAGAALPSKPGDIRTGGTWGLRDTTADVEVLKATVQQQHAEPKQAPPSQPQQRAMVRRDASMALSYERALEPTNMKQAVWLARKFEQSRLYQRKFKNSDELLVAIMAGRARGLDVCSALANIHVIEGAPSWASRFIVAQAKAHRDCEYFYMVSSDENQATFETKRRGHPKPERLSYTIEDAELAGLTTPTRNGKPTNWLRIPKPMLRKQAAVELAREVYPEVTAGMYTPEELTGGVVIDAEYEVVR